MDSLDDFKISLPKWLKIFTANGVSVPKVMAVAGKMYTSDASYLEVRSSNVTTTQIQRLQHSSQTRAID